MSQELREVEEEVLGEGTEFFGLIDADYGDAAFDREDDFGDGFGGLVHG